jgi:hypothetical protein
MMKNFLNVKKEEKILKITKVMKKLKTKKKRKKKGAYTKAFGEDNTSQVIQTF